MYIIRAGPRAFQTACRRAPRKSDCSGTRRGKATVSIYGHRNGTWYRGKRLRLGLASSLIVVILGTVSLSEVYAESPSPYAEIKFEKNKKRKGLSKEENRDTISSQHLQVKQSWENPGVYAWGSNSGRVVAPESDEAFVKSPRRISFFDGLLLRDLKLDRDFGAAITEDGDLLQWGKAYSEESRQPVRTLMGKGLKSLAISRDRIIALSGSGKVYSLPISKLDQENGPKPSESTWLPFWKSQSPISYRVLEPKGLSTGEKVSHISSGLEHLLLRTSGGRLFSAASSSTEFPSRGELGVSGLTWKNRPPGPYDQPHEITTLRGFEIASIATGDYHSLALDKEGRAFAFGDNSSGQLGFGANPESQTVDVPSLLPIQKLYAGTSLSPRVTSISAGGANSFFTIDTTRVAQPGESSASSSSNRITADTWACGQGILGTLGTGRWTHIQGTPTKIKALSSLFEFDERSNTVVPIRLKRLSVGSTHASATMDNVTHVLAGPADSPNETNWGADVLWWGGNEYYQLGLGKRNNISVPGYLPPLERADKGRGREEHRFQITPMHEQQLGGRKVSFEQRVECGRMVSAVYSGI